MTEVSNSDDVIDFRNVIERIEELESDLDAIFGKRSKKAKEQREEINAELAPLQKLADDLKGYGGDEQWRGDWYPITLVRASHWEDYAQQLAEDIGAIDRNASWPNNCIDWEKAARELQVDYSSVEFDGETYWYR